MAAVERLSSVVYFTTEFDFTKGFFQWHVCWRMDRLAIGARSKTFKTRVSDGDEWVKNRWVLEIVRDHKAESGAAIRLGAVNPRIPTPAIVRFSLFHDESNRPTFSAVGYTVFSSYAHDYTNSLPPWEHQRECGSRKSRVGCLSDSGPRDTELHCWFSFPIDLVARRRQLAKVVSYSFGRELFAYQTMAEGGQPEGAAAKEVLTVRVKKSGEEFEDGALELDMSIADPLLLDCVFQRQTSDGHSSRLLRPFVKKDRRKGEKKKPDRDGPSEAAWPVKVWYEAVMIACFATDQHRRNQWAAISRSKCQSLPQLKAICLVQLGAVSEPCCAPDEVETSPARLATPSPSPSPVVRRSRHAEAKRRRPSIYKKVIPVELQAELWRMKNFLRPLQTLEVGSRAEVCDCPCAIL